MSASAAAISLRRTRLAASSVEFQPSTLVFRCSNPAIGFVAGVVWSRVDRGPAFPLRTSIAEQRPPSEAGHERDPLEGGARTVNFGTDLGAGGAGGASGSSEDEARGAVLPHTPQILEVVTDRAPRA